VSWRLLLDPPASAAHNMSLDEALLACAERPTLRLYAWSCPSLSLGYRQSAPGWEDRCDRLGVELVRRASGGGAVVHSGDLTYAVVAPLATSGIPDDLQGSFEWIRDALLHGLRQAGLDARRGAQRAGADRLDVCFSAATGFEVELDGRKLVGSAQRRTPWGFLQHGSIRLTDDRALYRDVLGEAPPRPAVDIPAALASRAIVAAFERALGQPLERAGLSLAEREECAARLAARARDRLSVPPLVSSRFRPPADRLA
jgi:lipoate-protein ligase A